MITDCKEELRERVWRAFRQKYKERSGDEISPLEHRLERELEGFDLLHWHERFLLLQMLAAKCRSGGWRFATSMDGSFSAYLLNISPIHPLGLSLDWHAPTPFWIRTGAEHTDELRKSLMRFALGDALESETLRGSSFTLHPMQGGGEEFRIYGSNVYSVMEEAERIVGAPNAYTAPELWEGGFYHGYIPGFFTEAEEYELRHSTACNPTALASLLMEMRQIGKPQAVRLMMDYIAACDFLRRKPEAWFGAFLSQAFYSSRFDYASMACGKEVCSRARLRNRERLFFTKVCISGEASTKNELYRACEAAYDRGVAFLPPDPVKSDRTRFLPVEGGLLCPLGRAQGAAGGKEKPV